MEAGCLTHETAKVVNLPTWRIEVPGPVRYRVPLDRGNQMKGLSYGYIRNISWYRASDLQIHRLQVFTANNKPGVLVSRVHYFNN